MLVSKLWSDVCSKWAIYTYDDDEAKKKAVFILIGGAYLFGFVVDF